MENERVLGGLYRKRAEMADLLAAARTEVDRLAAALASVEATIRMFVPDAPLPRLRQRRPPHPHAAYHGGLSRPIVEALRGAPSGINTRNLAFLVLKARGLPTDDKAFVTSMKQRVAGSLRQLRERGVVASEARGDGQTWWRIA